MRKIILMLFMAALFIGCCGSKAELRHVVFFGFNEALTSEQVSEIESSFCQLPSKIDLIKGYEWGTDCSPEGLQRGHTHCFFLTFDSEADRDAYLVHPSHKEFGALIDGKLSNVTVVDYWVKK